MRRLRIKNAIKKYMSKHKRFAFGEIFEHMNKSRATNVTRTQLSVLMRGMEGLRKVKAPRKNRAGYEATYWEVEEE